MLQFPGTRACRLQSNRPKAPAIDTASVRLFASGINDKRILFLSQVALSIATSPPQAPDWEETTIELTPALGAPNAVGVFKYENKGDTPVHFKGAPRTSCGCTVAALQKTEVAPGEKGEITATFNIGDRTGVQMKTITVETDDPQNPTTVLTLKDRKSVV